MSDGKFYSPLFSIDPDDARRACRSTGLGLRLTAKDVLDLAADLPLEETRLKQEIEEAAEPIIVSADRLDAIAGQRSASKLRRLWATVRARVRAWLRRTLGKAARRQEPGTPDEPTTAELRRWILGQLDAKTEARVERSIIGSAATFERYQAIEDLLIRCYLGGDLSATDRVAMNDVLASSGHLKRRLEAANEARRFKPSPGDRGEDTP